VLPDRQYLERLKGKYMRLWTEVICLRTQADGGFLCAIKRTTRLPEMARHALPSRNTASSGLCSHELCTKFHTSVSVVSKLNFQTFCIQNYTRTNYSNTIPVYRNCRVPRHASKTQRGLHDPL